MTTLKDLSPENMKLAASKKITGVDVTDFAQKIHEHNNVSSIL